MTERAQVELITLPSAIAINHSNMMQSNYTNKINHFFYNCTCALPITTCQNICSETKVDIYFHYWCENKNSVLDIVRRIVRHGFQKLFQKRCEYWMNE